MGILHRVGALFATAFDPEFSDDEVLESISSTGSTVNDILGIITQYQFCNQYDIFILPEY